MRITDSRYDRDRLRLAVAYRIDRPRGPDSDDPGLHGSLGGPDPQDLPALPQGVPGHRVRRRRGKSPRQMTTSASPRSRAPGGGSRCHARLLRAARQGTAPAGTPHRGCGDVLRRVPTPSSASARQPHHVRATRGTCPRSSHTATSSCSPLVPTGRPTWIRDSSRYFPTNCAACRSADRHDPAAAA